jgi:hypothetical protein
VAARQDAAMLAASPSQRAMAWRAWNGTFAANAVLLDPTGVIVED